MLLKPGLIVQVLMVKPCWLVTESVNNRSADEEQWLLHGVVKSRAVL